MTKQTFQPQMNAPLKQIDEVTLREMLQFAYSIGYDHGVNRTDWDGYFYISDAPGDPESFKIEH